MARIRTVKPEFWNDEKLGQENEAVSLTYVGTWNFADDYGVVKANPVWLKNQIYPYKANLRIETFIIWLKRLEELDVLIPFVHRSESFYYIRTFRKHQKVDKPSKARNVKEVELIHYLIDKGYYLQPDGDCIKHSPNTPRTLPEPSAMEVVSSKVSSKGGDSATNGSKLPSIDEYFAAQLEEQQQEPEEPTFPGYFIPPVNQPPPPPPDIEEVKAYFKNAGSTEQLAMKFFNHHEGTGWRKGFTPVFAWRSIATNWISETFQNPNNSQTQKSDEQYLKERQQLEARQRERYGKDRK